MEHKKEYVFSLDGEYYNPRTYESEESALEAAKEEIEEVYGMEEFITIYTGVIKRPKLEQFLPDADTILEPMQERAEEVGGSYAESFLDIEEAQASRLTEELHKIVKSWYKEEKLSIDFWTVTKLNEYEYNSK